MFNGSIYTSKDNIGISLMFSMRFYSTHLDNEMTVQTWFLLWHKTLMYAGQKTVCSGCNVTHVKIYLPSTAKENKNVKYKTALSTNTNLLKENLRYNSKRLDHTGSLLRSHKKKIL